MGNAIKPLSDFMTTTEKKSQKCSDATRDSASALRSGRGPASALRSGRGQHYKLAVIRQHGVQPVDSKYMERACDLVQPGYGHVKRKRTGSEIHIWQVPNEEQMAKHVSMCLTNADGILFICTRDTLQAQWLDEWEQKYPVRGMQPERHILVWEDDLSLEDDVSRAFSRVFDQMERRASLKCPRKVVLDLPEDTSVDVFVDEWFQQNGFSADGAR